MVVAFPTYTTTLRAILQTAFAASATAGYLIMTASGVCVLRIRWIIVMVPKYPGISSPYFIWAYPLSWITLKYTVYHIYVFIQQDETLAKIIYTKKGGVKKLYGMPSLATIDIIND